MKYVRNFLKEKLKLCADQLVSYYTGPHKEKLYIITAIGAVLFGLFFGFGIHNLTRSVRIPNDVVALSETKPTILVSQASATDATTMAATTTPPATTTPETTSEATSETATETIPQETTTPAKEDATTKVPATVIPVTKLDIVKEDTLTDTLTQNKKPVNSAPALNKPLGTIVSSPSGYNTSAGFITGIDVSKHQGKINWSKVKNDGIEFAFIKVAGRGYETGKLYYDTRYKENLSEAAAAGIKVGAYFFSQATTVQEAREEASMIIDALKGYQITYPVVFDWETADGYRTNTGISKNTMTAMAETFCSMVENAGYKAMIYANTFDFERFHAKELTSKYASWLARYPANYDGNGTRFQLGDGIPSLDYPYQIWQYSSTGKVAGISENVDMNVAFVGFHKTSAPTVPMTFHIPTDEFFLTLGESYDILKDVQAYNCAGVLSTPSMKYAITDQTGKEVSKDALSSTSGIYTITYSLKDFTGYTDTRALTLHVQSNPVITLENTTFSIDKFMEYDDFIRLVSENLVSACDYSGADITDKVTIVFPEGFYRETTPSDITTAKEVAESSTAESSTILEETSVLESTTQEESSILEEITTSAATEETTSSSEEETTTEVFLPQKVFIPGNYEVTYTVTDKYGLNASVSASFVITE